MGSYSYGKDEVCAWIRQTFPPPALILDVGACDGLWRQLLPEYVMDAVEIFKPAADALSGYSYVINDDISNVHYDWYDLIIFGDVIEHMTVKKAQAALWYAGTRCRDMIIAVPWLYPQGECEGNPWQKHIQDDLTPEIFNERYPGFAVLWQNEEYCYFHKGGNHERDQKL